MTLTVRDSLGLADPTPATRVITVSPPSGATVVESRVSASTDDAEEAATGKVDVSSVDLELVFDTTNQTVGLRFNGITVPRGAAIRSAWIQFKVDELQSEATSLTIRAQAIDNAPKFSSAAAGSLSSRARTTASAVWSPPPWTVLDEVGPNEKTSDLSSVVREIVARPGWVSGNSVVILITGTGHRTAKSWNGDAAAAPLLHIEY